MKKVGIGVKSDMKSGYYIDLHSKDPKANARLKDILSRSFLGYWRKKRVFDIVAAFILIILTSPAMLLTALIIKLDDINSPVIYDQIRIGRHGKPFRLYKFRTMIKDADRLKSELVDLNMMDGPVFKLENDPRITRVGGFLRKTCLDELPQFINVLKGDMSIVGPRPPLPEEADQYDDYQRLRLLVTPGITCIWQIQPARNTIAFDDWVEMDLYYIEHRTMWLDIRLILNTPLAMFNREGR